MDVSKLNEFINTNIAIFHQNRLNSLNKLKLTDILKRKNVYLYKAKNIHTSEELIKAITDAYLSSQEETIFGEFLEKLAIFAAEESRSGFKSGIEGIDLEIIDNNVRYIVSIKSGPNWGNRSQIKKMIDYFSKAKRVFKTQNPLNKEYAKVINKFSREFLNTYFAEDGSIDWIKILKLNSENKSTTEL